MIERTEIDGRPCAVMYLSLDRKPVDKADAEMVRVIFDDGETMWAYAKDANADEGEADEVDDDTDEDTDPPDRGGPA